MEEHFDDLNDKIDSMEELINSKLLECQKKVNDLYSMQNKVNEITKMNNQSIINQINQYDEEIDDVNKNNQVFNSIENSLSPSGPVGFVGSVGSVGLNIPNSHNQNNLTNPANFRCFVKLNDVRQEDKEMFYMSSLEKHTVNSTKKVNKNLEELVEQENNTTSIDEYITQNNNVLNNVLNN
jgi:hypothetical protein